MAKKFFSAVILACIIFFGANVCSAGTFQIIYDAEMFTANMKRDQAVDETFNTNDGKLRFQLRKLANSSAEKRMHAIAWLNDKRIYEEYFPDVYGEYSFRAIKNTADSRQFYVIESLERSIMLGYEPVNGKLEIYIDSRNYARNAAANPTIVALKNGDLILAFENPTQNISARYLFTWDKSKNWFAYSDLGTYRYSIKKDRQKL